jgi:hypothetical protein
MHAGRAIGGAAALGVADAAVHIGAALAAFASDQRAAATPAAAAIDVVAVLQDAEERQLVRELAGRHGEAFAAEAGDGAVALAVAELIDAAVDDRGGAATDSVHPRAGALDLRGADEADRDDVVVVTIGRLEAAIGAAFDTRPAADAGLVNGADTNAVVFVAVLVADTEILVAVVPRALDHTLEESIGADVPQGGFVVGIVVGLRQGATGEKRGDQQGEDGGGNGFEHGSLRFGAPRRTTTGRPAKQRRRREG